MYSRTKILNSLKEKLGRHEYLLGVIAEEDAIVESMEKNRIDLLFVHNSWFFRKTGHSSLAGLLPFGDAGEMVMELGREIIPFAGDIPVIAGVNGTDPFRIKRLFLNKLKEQGFSGVQNFPTVGLIDGIFRQNLEETGFKYDEEVNMIREAHKLDLFTAPLVFNEKQACKMVRAGADVLVAHVGLMGTAKEADLEEAVEKIQNIIDFGKSLNPEIFIFCNFGHLKGPDEIAFLNERIKGVSGFICEASNTDNVIAAVNRSCRLVTAY